MSSPILPGACLGVLGSGQLGRMFAIAARRLGYRVWVLSPEKDTPTGQVADREVTAAYDDADAIRDFAEAVDVVTFEFENVPRTTVELVGDLAPVRPAGQVLHTTQHRLREKTFLKEHGFPVTPFASIRDAEDVANASDALLPGVLKTAAWGYDGKGQATVDDRAQLESVFANDFTQDAILEKRVDFDKEISVVAVRGLDGQTATYAPVENSHRNHILDVSVCPARIEPRTAEQATAIARKVLGELDVIGVLCVEFFVTSDGELLINELAPRPHNSGHLTIDAHVCCQFEQQVRSICGLPLGSTRLRQPAAMANLLGGLWRDASPDWLSALTEPEVKLHLYGKADARPGRKMGHITATAESSDEAVARVCKARDRL